MNKIGFIILVSIFSAYLAGCGKKEPSSEQLTQQEPMSMEALTTMAAEPEAKAPVAQAQQAAAVTPLEPLPPAGPYKPTINEIQTALKNAGYYTAKIDGISGPKTKQAIEEFQKANDLKADGKVGPKTWNLLGKYLIEREQ